MPGNLLQADQNFPQFTGDETDGEKIEKIMSYLFMLVEQLRYSMGNLDAENFNETGLEELEHLFTDPVYAQIQDANANMANLALTAEGLSLRLSGAEGSILQLTATDEALQSQISSAEGDISTLTQTAQSLQTQITGVDGAVSTLTQTVSGINSRVTGAEGDITALQQTASGLNISVSNLQAGMSSTLTMDYRGLIVQNGTGQAVSISGGQLTAGTVKADMLQGEAVSLINDFDSELGQLNIGSSSSADYTIQLAATYGALRFLAQGGNIYMQNSQGASLQLATNVQVNRNMIPNADDSYSCGMSGFRWSNIWAGSSTISTSDRQKKHDIVYGLAKYDALFDGLRPVSYKFNGGTSGRTHIGFISQDVEETLAEAGLTGADFGGFCRDADGAGGYDYSLRYEEFIALNTWRIKKLEERMERLEGAV